MTTSYLDFVARPDTDTTASVLLSGLFEQLHREFVTLADGTVGVSFPEAESTGGLGMRLRLHGSEDALRALSRMPWLARVPDYYRPGVIRDVPANHEARIVRRLQPNLSAAKIRRLVARGSMTEERGFELLDGRQMLDAPFVQIRSGSSGQRFKLFFEQVVAEGSAATGKFNAYGFGMPVPWF